jgi:RNA polymerase sigma-70 factor, ECF subfamily
MTRHGSFPTPDHEAGSERALSMNPPAFGDGLPRAILGRGASAFEERSRALVRDHFDFIWRLLRRTGLSPQDADDEAQRVFITVAQKLDQVVVGNERTYLYGTALRFAANFRRKARRRERHHAVTADVELAAGNDDVSRRVEAQDLLDRVLATLPPPLSRVLVLSAIEGWELSEIATAERIPAGTAASRLRRAKLRVREELERLGHLNPFSKGEP